MNNRITSLYTGKKITCLCVIFVLLCAVVCAAYSDDISVGHVGSTQGFPYVVSTNNSGFLAGDWYPLSVSDALNYFTPYEICKIRDKGACEEYKDTVDDNMGSCRVFDTGLTQACPNTMGALYRYHTTKPWPETRNILDLIQLMRSHKSNTLVLIGDSMTQQHFFDATCSIQRFGLTYSFHQFRSKPYHIAAHIRDPFDQTPSAMPYFAIHLLMYDNIKKDDWHHILKEEFYNHSFTSTSRGGRTVFVVNTGLHSGNPESLRVVAPNFFIPLIEIAKHHRDVLIYRETSAQHFYSPNGLYETRGHVNNELKLDLNNLVSHMGPKVLGRGKRSTVKSKIVAESIRVGCAPLADWEAYETQNWRNRIVQEILKEIDTDALVKTVEFYRITAGRHDLHTIPLDCTHYCHGPLLWLPLWDSIANVVEKELST